MGLVLDLLKPEIEKTIKGLDSKNFPPDPIAGPHFSKITSVMSSAYKRHGYILERAILEAPVDVTIGGWGQDGHVAYNQARRQLFHQLSLEDLANSTVRIQDNNIDTIIALAQRTFGAAYQFVPPMSVTLGMRECLGASKVRLYSDTGAWKQTALRVALFSKPTVEYPITLLQQHPDALITATIETARHPIAENPEWELF